MKDVLTQLLKLDSTQSQALPKRPIYVVAHMVNGNSQINADWVNPANAIESDLAFNSDGSIQQFYHGPFPCDCLRNCIKADNAVSHFAAIREKALHNNLTIFWMDLKLGASEVTDFKSSGANLAKIMTQNGSLFPPGMNVPLYILLGAESIEQKDFFVGFREYVMNNRDDILDNFGYDFSGTDSTIDDILSTFEEIGIKKNIWVGDGIINCIPRGTHRLQRLLKKRDQSDSDTIPFKVYSWTIDNESSLKKHLQLGVDAIITNKPEKLRKLIEEDFHDTLTLATQEVNPWEQIQSSEVATPLMQSCEKYWYVGPNYCWKENSFDDECWTKKKCSQPSDCYGELECSSIMKV